jgi:hypothetical protein
MAKIHYRTHTGADDRFHIISKTITVSADYFSSMRVLNLGPAQNSDAYDSLLRRYDSLSVVNMEDNYTLCITSDILRHHAHDIPDGEWLCFLDSDWRLPQTTLDNMHREIELAESEGFNALFSYQLGHVLTHFNNHHAFIDPTRTDGIDNDQIIVNMINHWTANVESSYGWPLFIKINKSMMWYDSWFENHGYVLPVPYKKKAVPSLYHIHIRDFNDVEYCRTMILQCWWYLGHHVFSKEEQYEIINSNEYKRLEEFKFNHRCFTSNHLMYNVFTNAVFVDELRKLFLSFEHSKIFSCQQMYRMAKLYNMVFAKTKSEPPCISKCCNYKHGYIKDL